MARASPVISSTVSPFVRSAIRKAAVCASEASPAIISWSTAAAFVRGQVLAAGQPVDGLGQDRVAHPRKLRRSALPCSVSTDSGWNCTPSAGSSRWRTPITTSPATAERSRQSGSSGSTTSEW